MNIVDGHNHKLDTQFKYVVTLYNDALKYCLRASTYTVHIHKTLLDINMYHVIGMEFLFGFDDDKISKAATQISINSCIHKSQTTKGVSREAITSSIMYNYLNRTILHPQQAPRIGS